MMKLNPFMTTDGYKTGHMPMYPEGTSLVASNFTHRSGKHSNVDFTIGGKTGIIAFGQQMTATQIYDMFKDNFFRTKELEALENFYSGDPEDRENWIKTARNFIKDEVCQEIKEEYSLYLGYDYDVSHIEDLWELGYLPVKIKALPEGTFVPYGVPVLTIVNTKPEFFWLTNFLETLISNMLWMPMTSATTAFEFKKILIEAATKTDQHNKGFVDFQGHNFGMRGMAGVDAAIYAGLGHATNFGGDDSLPTISAARKFYLAKGFVVGSIPATEHSVMCAGTKDDEIGTFRYLMKQFPTGKLGVVSDTWDLFFVLTVLLPQLKEEIMARDGQIVIRPDSGDPVDIICGTEEPLDYQMWYEAKKEFTPEQKGVVELLWDTFGGTTNDQGYKVLDPHIGAIYGDSITPERARQICARLEAKGFATTNVVLGIGSYTYQHVTRDTHGFAMKATYIELRNPDKGTLGEGASMQPETICREIFKDPKTSGGTNKKSAKGLLFVGKKRSEIDPSNHEYYLVDQVSWEQEATGELQLIFEDGKFYNQTTLNEIRERINSLI